MADYLKAFGPFFVGLVALSIAVFGEHMRRLVFRPRLSLAVGNQNPYCVMNRYLSVGEQSVERPHYSLRLAIENLGNSQANNVEVFAMNLQRQKGREQFEPVNGFVGAYLAWSDGEGKALELLNPGMPKYCYLGRVFCTDGLPESWHSRIPYPKEDYLGHRTIIDLPAPGGSGQRQRFGPGNYLLTVRIGAANAKQVQSTLKINVTGRWPTVEPGDERVNEVLDFGKVS